MNTIDLKKIKTISIILAAIGIVSIIIGFVTDVQREWASLLFNNFFFFAIALAAAFFVAVQYVSNSGWSIVIQRVPEAIGTYLPVALVLMAIIILGGMHSIYHWSHHDLYDPNSEHYDPIIAGKQAYLNLPFFIIRMVVYMAGWLGLFYLIRKNSIAADFAPLGDNTLYKKNFRLSAIFIVFFAVTSSASSWDWLMSIDTHWFSTLFGWYIFSGMFVSSLVVITLTVLYLKSKGALPSVNDSHIHDLGKFVFAFSIFWTYLWVSQFLLYWYANIPEEITYYQERFQNFKTPLLIMLAINFVMPVLILMTRAAKQNAKILMILGAILLVGHWVDLYLLVMPGIMGNEASVGIHEIGSFFFFAGAFLFVVFNNMSKVSLEIKNHPYIEESVHHHS